MESKLERLLRQMNNKILILDGAMGTLIQQANLSADDFGGEQYEGCNEMLNLTKPELIERFHEQYLEAGADIIETNTFGATSVVLEEYGLAEKTEEINVAAVHIAKKAANKFSTKDHVRFVAGSIGPTTRALSVTGGISFDQLVQAYFEQAKALIKSDVDILLIETAQDTLNVKACGLGIQHAFEELDTQIPIMISGTIESNGTTLAGQNIESFFISLEHLNPISVGLNCATGPEFMRDHVRSLSEISTTAISCYPNAGLPDEEGHYHEGPKELAKKMSLFAENGWLNIAGGCCGTTPEHIRELASTLKNLKPRKANQSHPPAISGIDAVFIEKENRPVLIGERTNVIGSKKFRELIAGEKYDEASEIARAQVKGGAQIIDVCLANPDRDELYDTRNFVKEVVKKIKTPLMIDSTDSKVIEQALKFSQGKAIINSINLEDGEEKFSKIASLIHQYGAAVVVGTIDERGMAITLQRKIEVINRSYSLLVDKYQINPQDIIFDPLVFPIGTGDKEYENSAVETMEAIKYVKENFPNAQTILGISNISFGLPLSGREVLNSVFLYNATLAGLDYAIVNTERLKRYANISEEEKLLAEKLLFNKGENPLTPFVSYFREKKTEIKNTDSQSTLSLEERLINNVVEGSKDGLTGSLANSLKQNSPLEIINGPLMEGMDKVGELFNSNKLIVAEVLQSAEVMKEAVSFLEPFMEKKDASKKGKILLATVKGDVHDIGKNLTDIILSNNGYEVINLGIKITPEQLIEAFYKEKPDIIGLSGLLVKSAQQMMVTAQDLKISNIDVPLIVGGAALTRKFTNQKIAPEYLGDVYYAKDAMDGLSIINKIIKEKRSHPKQHKHQLYEEKPEQENVEFERAEPSIPFNHVPIFKPKDLNSKVLINYPIENLIPFLNMQRLLGKHLGLKGNIEQLLLEGNQKAIRLQEQVYDVLREALENNILKANGTYRFFPANSDGNQIIIYDPIQQDKVITSFTFPRQRKEPFLAVSDYLHSVKKKEKDYLGFFVVTTGHDISTQSKALKEKGELLHSYMLQAIAIELAEAFAEKIHQLMRIDLGIKDSDNLQLNDYFAARYQGVRLSFGYPACPNLEDQTKLFELLQPHEIGVELTDGFMMDPEATVSGLVFANPNAKYFSVE